MQDGGYDLGFFESEVDVSRGSFRSWHGFVLDHGLTASALNPGLS